MMKNDLTNKLDKMSKDLIKALDEQEKDLKKIIHQTKNPVHKAMLTEGLKKAKTGDFKEVQKIIEELGKM